MSDKIFGEKDGDPVEVYPGWDDEYFKKVRLDKELRGAWRLVPPWVG